MSEMTPDRLRELRRIAEAATPGPWEWNKYLHLFSATGKPVLTKPFSPDNPDVVEARPEDLDYIERFNPETVLALLDEIERLRREREEIVDSETHFALYHPDLDVWECQACRFSLRARHAFLPSLRASDCEGAQTKHSYNVKTA